MQVVRQLVLGCLLAGLAVEAHALECPSGELDVRVVGEPGLDGGVRPQWSDDGPVLYVDPRAGGYEPVLFARQLYQFALMHGLAHFCLGHVDADMAARFARDPDYLGWRSPGAELAADCWAAERLAQRRSRHVAAAAAIMFDNGDGIFTGNADNPDPGRRAARVRSCAGID